ncbi:MAG: PAS domain-containing sensor histidine kinase [Bacteroidota bacterium]
MSLRLLLLLAAFALAAAPLSAQTDEAETATGDPWSRPAVSLAEALADDDDDGVPDRIGEEMVVSGRVSAGTGLVRADRAEIYLQSGSAGLRLLLPPDAPQVLTGDSLSASGALAFEAGIAQMVNPAFRVADVPQEEPEHLDLGEIDGPLEGYEGQLVEIVGDVVQVDAAEGGHLLVLLSGKTLVQVFAYDERLGEPVALDRFEVGQKVRARGIASQYDTEPPYDAGYVLHPRAPGDVRTAGIPPRMLLWSALGALGLLVLALVGMSFMRREVRRRATLLRESETRYAYLFDAAGDVVLVYEIEGDSEIVEANRAAQMAFGLDEEGRKGPRSIGVLELATDPEASSRHLSSARRLGHALDVLELNTRGGSTPFEISTRRLALPTGDVFVSVARDVEARRAYETGLLEAMQEAEHAREEAEAAARLKSAILANMSHEIRTPLTAIIGFADVLVDESPPQLREHAETIRAGGGRLLDTLNSVLDLARLDSDNHELQAEPFDVVGAVRQSVSLLAPLAHKKGLALHLEADTPTVHVRQSASGLDRILTNLVGNAIKFTESGEIRVSVHSADTYFAVRVRDTGVGIDEGFLDDLFEPFKQESEGHSRSHEGTGLGLAITKRLSERMGGDIRVWSRKSQGSLFEVSLPRVAPGVTGAATADTASSGDGAGVLGTAPAGWHAQAI